MYVCMYNGMYIYLSICMYECKYECMCITTVCARRTENDLECRG